MYSRNSLSSWDHYEGALIGGLRVDLKLNDGIRESYQIYPIEDPRLTLIPPNDASLPFLVTTKDFVGSSESSAVPYFNTLTASDPMFVTETVTLMSSTEWTDSGAEKQI